MYLCFLLFFFCACCTSSHFWRGICFLQELRQWNLSSYMLQARLDNMTSTSDTKVEKQLEAIDRPINWDSSATEASIKEQAVTTTPSLHSLREEKHDENSVKSDKNDIVTPVAEDETQYLEGPKLWLVMLGLGLACLLVGLVCPRVRFDKEEADMM